MRDALPAVALLGASLGLSAGSAPAGAPSVCWLALATLAVARYCVGIEVSEQVLVPAWIAVALAAGTLWLPRRWHCGRYAMLLGLGSVCAVLAAMLPTASAGLSLTLFVSALALAAAGSALLFARGWILPARIAASWLVAIAALNITLTILPVTAGYLPDHLE